MTRIYDGHDWRYGFRHSRIVCLIWSAEPRHAEIQRQKLAYAQALGKPIRVLILAGERLPEDFCPGYADVQVARMESPAQTASQVKDWLDALPEET